MDDLNLATATHRVDSYFLPTLRFPRRHALSNSEVSTLRYRTLSILQAGGLAQKTHTMVNLGGHLEDPSGIFAQHQKIIIQRLAVAFSILSTLACLVSVYWYFMLKKNFRRNLVFLLIIADGFKSLWYLVFASTALSVGGITTDTAFCQTNGWLLQASIEGCDMAILFMSLHMYLQIFSPNSRIFGHDGLYRFRHTVLGFYIGFPVMSASLAFINQKSGYISQGPFCTLPLRPFWYRLALTWIPRYIIWAYIMFVALRIYLHVGGGLKVFAREQGRMSTGDIALDSLDTNPPSDDNVGRKEKVPPSIASTDHADNTIVFPPPGRVTLSPEDGERYACNINWTPNFTTPPGFDGPPHPAAASESRRGSRVVFQGEGSIHMDFLQVPPEQKRARGSISTISSFKTNGDGSYEGTLTPTLEPIQENRVDHLEAGLDEASGDTPLKKRRRAIQRQLRLLFIYPVAYMIMWTVPFAYHSMNYSDYYAQHPVYVLAASAVACQTALGCVDCIVFGWREKPWKHIHGSDGTFLGSFMFWKFMHDPRRLQWSTPAPGQIPDTHEASGSYGPGGEQARRSTFSATQSRIRSFVRSNSHTSARPILHRSAWSTSSDRAALEAERAAARLALERAEREQRGLAHLRSESLNAPPKPPIEWWDRRLSHAVHSTPYTEDDEV